MSCHFRSPRLTNHSSFTIFWKAGLWPPVDRCEQSDGSLRKLPNYGVNVHHRKAIVQFVGKISLMCLSIWRLDMANPTVASEGEPHCMSWVRRPVPSTNSSSASLWLRQRFPAASSSFGLEMVSVCCLCYLSGLLANVFHFLFETCHRHCKIAEVKPGRAGLVLGWVTATGMLIGSFNTIGERKWLLI